MELSAFSDIDKVHSLERTQYQKDTFGWITVTGQRLLDIKGLERSNKCWGLEVLKSQIFVLHLQL